MIWKKAIISILIILMIPAIIVAQERDPVDELSGDISESWQEAKSIWGKVYLYAKDFWFKNIDWRLTPLKGWVKIQLDKLSSAFKSDVKEVEENIKEETKEVGKSAMRKIWEMIVGAIKH